ncbi:MAG: hypothetical protein ACLU02_00975 [Clostridia bacterium]|jgi:hypothetical protein
MKKIRRKVNKPLLYFVFFVFASVTVGYAALSTTLSITGKGTLSKNSWDIHFENLVIVDNGASVVTTAPTIDSTKTKVSFNITLSKPGDTYEFTVDAVNKGTIDAMLSGFSATSLTTDQQKYLTYTVTYSDGATISTKDYLKKGTSETIRVRVRFRDDLTSADLPSSAETLNLTATLVYVQADSTAKERAKPSILCIRDNTATSEDLMLGDKLYCDVNGDGTYNESTEIFYYLKDLDSDSTSAVLIYNNVTSSDYVAYSKTNTLNGPTIASKYLPTISEWPNVSLTKAIRDIKSQDSDFIIKGFNYSGYAARLPSLSEVESCANESNCPITGVIWLETPKTQSNALYLFAPSLGYNQIRDDDVTSLTASVMPVIEVPKSRISY